MRLLLPAIAGFFLFACTSDGGGDDGGRPDAGDARPRPDAGPGEDGGPARDAEPGEDGGAPDSAMRSDAGGGGSFSERVIDESGVHGQGVEVIDLEGDGDLDVMVAFSLTDTIRIYVNDGSGGFSVAQPAPNDTIVAMHAVAEDLDGDGDRDLAAVGLFDRAIGFASPGEVTWFENPGDPMGSWTRHEITGLTFWAPLRVVAGDLTGDGRPDLVVGCTFIDPNGNGVFWFRNTGGGFSGPTPIEADLRQVSAALIHDIDGDGVLDVLAASTGGGELVWYENERTGPDDAPTFTRHTLADPAEPYGMRLANMDGDPELEVVSSGSNGAGGGVAWYDPPADPRELWTEHVVSAEHGDQSTRVTAADLDGDGLTDVAITSLEDAEVRVFFAGGAGGFTNELIMGGHTGANAIAAGDLDGDLRIDLITTTYGYSDIDRISWWDNEL